MLEVFYWWEVILKCDRGEGGFVVELRVWKRFVWGGLGFVVFCSVLYMVW